MIRSLRAIDFRCFDTVAVTIESPRVFFTGQNAQGKTSLLEAIAVATRLGSPRASRQSQMVREGAIGCGVACETDQGLFKAIYQDRKFELSLDGVAEKKKDYLQKTPRVVWMENRDLDLIRGSGERRRRYLDAIGSQLSPVYAKALRDYTKALRSRNALLKSPQGDERTLQMFSELLVRNGEVLIQYRARILEDLLPFIMEAHHVISNGGEQFTLQYQPSTTDLGPQLQESLPKDRIMKQTLVGPHRDDFLVLVDGRAASDFASEGQQRTLAVALRLAQGDLLRAQVVDAPVIFLVDDVFGELDEMRRRALMMAFPEECQVVLTTTHLNWGEVQGQVFQLERYKISEIL